MSTENHRYLLFSDAHQVETHWFDAVGEHAVRERVNTIIFLGDIDGLEGFKGLLSIKSIAQTNGIRIKFILGNHDYCWGKFVEGYVSAEKIPPEFKSMLVPELTRESVQRDQILDLFHSMKVSHEESQMHFRHALPPSLINKNALNDSEFQEQCKKPVFNRSLLKSRFWAALQSPGFDGKHEEEVRRTILQGLKNQETKCLFYGHDHRSGRVSTLTQNTIVKHQCFKNGVIIPDQTPALIHIPAFEKEERCITMVEKSDRGIEVNLTELGG